VARLTQGEIREILQMLEDGINLMHKLDRVQKLKMRSRIRRQITWLTDLRNPTAEFIFHGLEERLSDLFSSYPYGFSDKLRKLLKEKLARFRSP